MLIFIVLLLNICSVSAIVRKYPDAVCRISALPMHGRYLFRFKGVIMTKKKKSSIANITLLDDKKGKTDTVWFDAPYMPFFQTPGNEDAVQGAPLAGSLVAAGFPSPADDYLERQLDLNEYLISNRAATFFVRVSGDSMINAGIHDRDLLIVDRSIDPEIGHVVIAAVDGEMVVKRLHKTGNRLFLVPENPSFPALEIQGEMDLTVWGVVTYVIHAV